MRRVHLGLLCFHMSEAVDNLHAIERLVALASSGPRVGADTVLQAHTILSKMGYENGATGYKAEKLKVVWEGFDSLCSDAVLRNGQLLRDIDYLRKAMARGAEGQD